MFLSVITCISDLGS